MTRLDTLAEKALARVRRRGPGLAFVMTADVADVAASHPDVIAP